jgi:hypothetical protein
MAKKEKNRESHNRNQARSTQHRRLPLQSVHVQELQLLVQDGAMGAVPPRPSLTRRGGRLGGRPMNRYNRALRDFDGTLAFCGYAAPVALRPCTLR